MPRVEHPRCPYCKGYVRPIDSKEACHQCMAWHHEECWEEHGRCAACNTKSDAPRKTKPGPAKREISQLSDLITPKGMVLAKTTDGLEITRRWFGGQFIALAFFCLLWDGFMVVWFTLAFSNGQLLMAAFGTLHAAVGVALTYFTVAGFLNTTTIELQRSRFRVKHQPLPWPGSVDMAADDLDQLFCTRKVSHSDNGTSVTYEVQAELSQDRRPRRITLLSGLERLDQAQFVERKVEEFLGIVDRPVEGEAQEGE